MELKHVIRAVCWLAAIAACLYLLFSGVSCEFLREIYSYLNA